MLSVNQLTSSQYTDEVIQAVSGVNEFMFSELMNVVSQLRTAVSQLQRDVTELKTDTRLKDANSKLMD